MRYGNKSKKRSGEARDLARELRRKTIKELIKKFKEEGGMQMPSVRLEVFCEAFERREEPLPL